MPIGHDAAYVCFRFFLAQHPRPREPGAFQCILDQISRAVLIAGQEQPIAQERRMSGPHEGIERRAGCNVRISPSWFPTVTPKTPEPRIRLPALPRPLSAALCRLSHSPLTTVKQPPGHRTVTTGHDRLIGGQRGHHMRVLLVGAPGSGKGTQAVRLSEHFGVPHISSGQLLREHMLRETPEGKEAAEYVDHGDLVPGDLVQEILREPVRRAAAEGGYVLDGFPRTIQQAEFVQLHPSGADFAVNAAVLLEVSNEELTRRLLARARGVDDSRDVIEHRLHVFDEHTTSMLEFFERRGELITVDAAQPVEVVTAAILEQLQAVADRIELVDEVTDQLA